MSFVEMVQFGGVCGTPLLQNKLFYSHFNNINIACMNLKERIILCQDNYTPDSFYSLDSTKTSCYNIVKSEKIEIWCYNVQIN